MNEHETPNPVTNLPKQLPHSASDFYLPTENEKKSDDAPEATDIPHLASTLPKLP